MPIFQSPLAHTGQPPNVTGTPSTQVASVRAATQAEVTAGTNNHTYICPLTLAAALAPISPGAFVATNKGTSASPTGTTSATFVMMGLGSAWALTPKTYGNVRITIDGMVAQSTTADGVGLKLAYGTGTAPINGAALTCTVVGSTLTWTALTGMLTVPFAKDFVISGLTPGTAYWFDLQMEAITGGTASVTAVEFTAQEIIA